MNLVPYTKKLLRQTIPPPVINWAYDQYIAVRVWSLKRRVLFFLQRCENLFPATEREDIIRWLRHHKLCVFPYDFSDKYKPDDIRVHWDEAHGMHYVEFENKPLYFKRGLTESQIQYCYSSLLREQDPESPHRYLDPASDVSTGDVVVDIGAAEGIFALSIIDRASKVYLIECDEAWIEALRLTFSPYANKIEIISKFISDRADGDQFTTLDNLFEGIKVDFIKADIEGAEVAMLNGAEQLMSRSVGLKMVLCTYHNEKDADTIQNILCSHNFKIRFSDHYMLFFWDKRIKAPYLRPGVIRTIKGDIQP